MVFFQGRLVIPKIDVTCRTSHEKLYHATGTSRVMEDSSQHPWRPLAGTEWIFSQHGRESHGAKTGRSMLKKLKVYAGPDHEHEAQQPQPLET